MQFIPRLSSTSINNKHLHETRARLRGRDGTAQHALLLLQPSVCSAPHLLSTGLVFSCRDPPAPPRHSLYLCLLARIKAASLSAVTETPQCWRCWHTAPVAHDKRQTLWSVVPRSLRCLRYPLRPVGRALTCGQAGSDVTQRARAGLSTQHKYWDGCYEMQRCILSEPLKTLSGVWINTDGFNCSWLHGNNLICVFLNWNNSVIAL